MTRTEVIELITAELAKHTDPTMGGNEHRCHCGTVLWREGNGTTMKRHRAECVASLLIREGLLKVDVPMLETASALGNPV